MPMHQAGTATKNIAFQALRHDHAVEFPAVYGNASGHEKIATILSQNSNSPLVKQTERSYYSARSKLVLQDLKN